MGVCTSSNKRKKKDVVKIKNKKDSNNNGEIATSREPKIKGLDIIGKIEEKELRRCNTNKTDCDNSHKKLNVYKCQTAFQNLETFEMMMNTENIPLSSFKEKKILKEDNIKTETSEKRSNRESNNFINNNFKEDNTIASIINEKNIINKNIDDNLEDIPKEIENDKNIINSKEHFENNKNEKKDSLEKIENEEINKNDNISKNSNEEKKDITNCAKINNDLKNSNNNKDNVNTDKNVEIKNEVKNYERIIEDDTFSNITFLKDFNNINIKKNNYKINSVNNNNYYSYKGNLFNLNSEVIDINKDKDKDGLYYFTEFRFTENKNYSSEKEYNNLLNSQTFLNKIKLTDKLLNLQERQWYKESILLSDSLKMNRENTYLDSASLNHYLNKIINLYNHFNWLVWAISYYYCNSLLFNKNHWFNSKNSNLPSYDNLDWIRGFEWKGLYIKVQTYNESKKIMKEIKALKYAFLDYIKVIDGFKYKTNINSLNLLSNELIFPFISYTYFGGIIIYVSASIKKFCYDENSIFDQSMNDFNIKRENINQNNSNTKSNTNSNRNTFDVKDKQFDEISEVTNVFNKYINKMDINEDKKLNNENIENKNFLKFNEDYISLNENLINDDINLSGYSRIDLENSRILSKITENNLIKIVDDISANSNINSEKYKFMLNNIYSLIPNLFKESEFNNFQNISYIKYKNDYQTPRIYELLKKDFKENEIDTLNGILDESIEESNINVYQNNLNGIKYRIIYQNNKDKKNIKITNFFVKFPLIQNRELSDKIINQYLKKKNINFIMHNFQIKNRQEITDNNIILFKNNLQPKMKYSIISKENENLTVESFHAFINNISKNINSYRIELRNVDNLLNFCEKFGLNTIFLPFLISKIRNNNIVDLMKIYLFSNIIKQYFCYNQGQNLLIKLSVYEACKDKDILNSTDNNVRDNNMIELQRTLLVNIIKFFLLPSQFIDRITSFDESKKEFVNSFMENLSFFTFIHVLKIIKFQKFLNFSETFLSKKNIKDIIIEYSIICRNNPFLFIDTLEKLINFRMNPYLKYKASLDVQNLKELKKEEIVIFSPKINSFIELSSITGYIFSKSIGNNNLINNSVSNNLLLSNSNINVTTKIGKVDSYMINKCNSKYNNNNNNITKRLQEENDEENITISNNGLDDLSGSLFTIPNNNLNFQIKNKLFNQNDNNNIITNDINNDKKKSKLSFKNILNDLILDNFLPSKIDKNYINNYNQSIISRITMNNYNISEGTLNEFYSNIEKILGEVISFNGLAEMIIFKANIYKVFEQIFFVRNLKKAKELINKMKEKFERQYLFTFNQCAVLAFLESLTYEKIMESQDFYCKTLIFSLFNLGDMRCNNCNGHQFLLLPLFILCKVTGYLDGSDTNEYFKEMFRCLNFKINKYLKSKEVEEKYKKLLYYCFPSVSDLKSKNNDFFYEKDFIIFLINSLLNFFYSEDNLLIDNDYLSYNKINFKISKNEEENNLDSSLNTSNKISDNKKNNSSHYILDILLDKMSYLKYGPGNIIISFGINNFNQTTHDNYDMLTLPRVVFKLCDIKVKKIFSGYNYNFIIDNKNDIYSWGDNSCGQCGIGDKNIVRSPMQVFFPELMDDFIENIICGKETTYFISNHQKIFLCGFNIIIKKNWFTPTLLELDFDSNIKQIKCGEDFTLFLTEKGNLYSMGEGSEGQLGMKFNINEQKRYCSKPTKILNSIKIISCRNKHSFAVSYNGDVFGWGNNNKGQLGLNFCEDMRGGEQNCHIFVPEKIIDYLDDIEIKNIECGSNYSFFQTKNNDLLACGNNDKEQLGIQDNNNVPQQTITKMCNDYIIPTEIEQFSLLKVNQIACGEEHCLAIIKDTISDLVNIWCWGSNKYGQLGLGSHINISKPKPNHYLLEFINHIPIDISVGSNHSILLLQRKDYNELNSDETLTKLILKYAKI